MVIELGDSERYSCTKKGLANGEVQRIKCSQKTQGKKLFHLSHEGTGGFSPQKKKRASSGRSLLQAPLNLQRQHLRKKEQLYPAQE